jgi:tRNA A-37 threonylcarbamoyl transferase component Bud32
MEFMHGQLLSDYLESRIELDVRFMMKRIGELVETLAGIHRNGIGYRKF